MSFFRALFDFSFSEFITSKIIKFLYVITIIIAALAWLYFLVTTISQGGLSIVVAVIGAPIGFLLQVIFTRVGLEILMVVFGIAEHVRDMSWALTGGRKAPTAAGPQIPQQPQYAPQPQQYAAPQPPPQAPRAQPQYPQYPQQPPQQPPQPPQQPQYPQYPPQQPPQPPQYPPKP